MNTIFIALLFSSLSQAQELQPEWVQLVHSLHTEGGGVSAKLKELKSNPSLDAELLAQIRTADSTYKNEALIMVRMLKQQSLLKPLLELLDKNAANDQDLSKEIEAINSLANADNFAVIEKNYSRNFPSDKLNASKAATLGLYFEVERAPEKATLMQFLKKGTAEQKIQAAQIAEFGLAKDPKYADVLIEALNQKPEQVRASAALSLSKLDKSQLEAMRTEIAKCAMDRKMEVREACKKLMQKLSGEIKR
jgi:HEAT repeat protein